MITTVRAARFLQRLPAADAAALLDAVVEVAAAPLANPRHCKHLAPRLYECRASLPPSRQYRLMFSYRLDGQPVLLSACLKKSTSDHERAIRAARQEITSPTPISQESAMPHKLPIFSLVNGWLYAGPHQYKVIHMTRKKVIVDTPGGRVTLSRSRLEGDGFDVADGVTYSLTRYRLPHEAQELAS